VAGLRHFPQLHAAASAVQNAARVRWRDVAVFGAVDQQYGNPRRGDCGGRRNFLELHAVAEVGVPEARFDDRAQKRASQPSAATGLGGDAIVGDLAEAGEGRLGGHGLKARLIPERLEKNGRAHGFSEPEDVAHAMLGDQPVHPARQVAGLSEPIGGDGAAALALRAGIDCQHVVLAGQKQPCIGEHAAAMVGLAVQQNHGLAAGFPGAEEPGL